MALATELAELLSCFTGIYITKAISLKKGLLIFCFMICVGSVGLLVYQIFNTDKNGKPIDEESLVYPALLLVINWGIGVEFNLAYLINVEYF